MRIVSTEVTGYAVHNLKQIFLLCLHFPLSKMKFWATKTENNKQKNTLQGRGLLKAQFLVSFCGLLLEMCLVPLLAAPFLFGATHILLAVRGDLLKDK